MPLLLHKVYSWDVSVKKCSILVIEIPYCYFLYKLTTKSEFPFLQDSVRPQTKGFRFPDRETQFLLDLFRPLLEQEQLSIFMIRSAMETNKILQQYIARKYPNVSEDIQLRRVRDLVKKYMQKR